MKEFCTTAIKAGNGWRMGFFGLLHVSIITFMSDASIYSVVASDKAGSRTLNAASFTSTSMTVASCAAFCVDYQYAGVEYARVSSLPLSILSIINIIYGLC